MPKTSHDSECIGLVSTYNNLLIPMFAVFISTVKFRSNVMYMGGVPVAEHCTLLPAGTTSTVDKTILGGTSVAMFEFS